MSEPLHGDPLARPPVALGRRVGIGAALVGAAVVLHVVATAGISGASWVIGLGGDGVVIDDEPVEVAIVDTPPAPDPDPQPDPIEPDPDTAPQPDPIEPDPRPDPKPDADPDPKPKRAKPAPDPNPPETPAQPDKPQPQRVVGLELESTVTGGDGPSYATGNTRTGKTARTAVDPRKVERRTAPPPPPPPPPASSNQVASDIPGSKVVVVKPKRVSKVKPDYPELLRARGIEGTVVVRVTIDARGRVTKVDIVAASKHDELNQAAREAALREQFTPATRNGAPVEFSLSFSYRFRLNDV